VKRQIAIYTTLALLAVALVSLTADIPTFFSRTDGLFETEGTWASDNHDGPSNQSHPDSLGRIILDMYDIGHHMLIEQEKEGLGLLMVLGCYMEGMNLIMQQGREHDLILFVHLLHQQKNYGNNLASLLDQYEIPSEIQEEYANFKNIIAALNAMDIPSVYQLKTGKRTIAGIKEGQLEKIDQELESFRTSILI
jgi:hypothetical protein